MIKHTEAQAACRARALTLVAATTGLATLSRTANGFARASGSFVADGFQVGMEIEAIGFNAAYLGTLIGVSASNLYVEPTLAAQSAGANRTIQVGLPSLRGWGNTVLTPEIGRPYIEEDYVFGPNVQPGIGRNSHVIGEPQYVLRFYVASGVDTAAHTKYAEAMLSLFPPHDTLLLASGQVLRVRSSPAPYAGQVLPRADLEHWSMLTVTVPLRAYTVNPS